MNYIVWSTAVPLTVKKTGLILPKLRQWVFGNLLNQKGEPGQGAL